MFSSFAVAELSACSDVCVPQQCKSYYSEKGPQCQHIFSNIFNYFLESVIFPVFTAYTGIANRSDSAKSDSFSKMPSAITRSSGVVILIFS